MYMYVLSTDESDTTEYAICYIGHYNGGLEPDKGYNLMWYCTNCNVSVGLLVRTKYKVYN